MSYTNTKSGRLAFDQNAYNLWLATLLLFLFWWLLQLVQYTVKIFQARRGAIRIGEDREDRGDGWAARLTQASKVARDCFAFMLAPTVLATAVGGTHTMVILGWSFFMLSIFWLLGTLATPNP
ncbi:hypothetical protein HK097_009484 [Rhizophlyctis rosea]|uniref:Uncharacterized protein n=1 Tax=Rhizophlyctis rosea TaxID=64517 RepID=A0AAD5SJA6_9FUNG|nr:hypothetical protein HK097_009484 [Rhizophlyctis rosea]